VLRRAALAVSILFPLVCLGARPARAEGADYALDNKDWNGLSDLVSIAEGRGLTVEVRAALRWSDIGPSDVLFLLYPTARVEPVHLAAFLRNGGRALIADDFGRADEALARLGILRKEMRPHPGVRLHEGNSNLPIATPVDDHPLARGVPQLNTNHPAAFQVSPGPDVIFSYQSGGGRDEAVVVAGALGMGKFVALSDPSVLINDMLAFDGNLAFAVNLLDFLGDTRPGRVLVITGEATLAGEPPEVSPESRGARVGANDLLAELGRGLEELNDYLAPEAVLRLFAVLGGVAVLVVGVILLPRRRESDPDTGFARVAAEPPAGERLLRDLDRDDGDALSYGYPAAVLRDNVEDELAARAAAGGGPAVARALDAVRRLPTRATVLGPGAYVPRRDFVEAHSAVVVARRSTDGR
jgi:uncharacterized protein DUF4350